MSDELFRKMAQRLTKDQAYIAYVLDLIMTQDELNWETLAQRYEMPLRALTEIALCRRPRQDKDSFHQGVEEIASAIGVKVATVVSLLRYGEGLAALAKGSAESDNSQSLAAARDRDDED